MKTRKWTYLLALGLAAGVFMPAASLEAAFKPRHCDDHRHHQLTKDQSCPKCADKNTTIKRLDIAQLEDYVYSTGNSSVSIDPAVCFTTSCVQLLNATCSKLVDVANLQDTLGGTAIVPEIADVVPSTSNGGIISNADGSQTYIFHLKHSFKLSNGEKIDAYTVKATLNRMLRVGPQYNGAVGTFYSVINGANDAIQGGPGSGATASGIVAKDRHTLAITISAPAGDFLNRMTLSLTCVLPKHTSDTLLTDVYPGSGPYHLAKYPINPAYATDPTQQPHTNLLATRNPFYPSRDKDARPAKPDKINIIFGITELNGDQEAGVIKGIYDIGGVPDADLVAIIEKYETPVASQPTLTSFPGSGIDYLQMNIGWASATSQIPDSHWPLCNPYMRQAVNYLLDRNAIIAAALGYTSSTPQSVINTIGFPIDQYLAPPVPGYSTTEAATPVHSYDGDQTNALAQLALFRANPSYGTSCNPPAGWTATSPIPLAYDRFVVDPSNPGPTPAFDQEILNELNQSQYNINAVFVLDDLNGDPNFNSGKWDLFSGGWDADYLDGFDFLSNIVASTGSVGFYSVFTDYDALLAAAELITDPTARAANYGVLNSDLISGGATAPTAGNLIPYGSFNALNFTSSAVDPASLVNNGSLGGLIYGDIYMRKQKKCHH